MFRWEVLGVYHAIISFFQAYTTPSVIVRMLLAVACGGIIGMERGRHGRAAGLRTHVLVSVGAAISAIVGLYTTEILGYSNDPLRVGAQVISGIGFLGVGSILVVGKSHVRGLTTAAGLWATASIGLACGIGYAQIACAATVIVFMTMTVMSRLEASARFESNNERYYIELSDLTMVNGLTAELRQELDAADITVIKARSGVTGNIGIEVVVPVVREGEHQEKIRLLQQRDGIIMAVRSW